ncbi:MAG: MFS transporter [Gammaproteobacteria bacterium]|nr:MFS transporter [Gammaproteobacteria bacterium]
MPISEPRLRRRIVLLALAAFASAMSIRIGDPLLPELASVFGLPISGVAPTVSGFAFAYGCLQLIYGPVGDRFGQYHVIAGATLASVVGSLGSAVAASAGTLIAFRVLTGATAAAIIPLAMAWIGDHTSYQNRQAVLARFLTGQILGLACGQLMGGLLADLAGWRSAFLFLAAVYLAAGALLAREITAPSACDATLRPAVAAAPFYRQITTVLRHGWARAILTWVLIEGAAAFGAFAFAPTYLHQRFGLTLRAAGALMSLFGVGGLGYALLARRFIARLGEPGLALGGGLLLSTAFLTLGVAPQAWWAAPAALAAGLGFYMLHNTFQTHGTQMAPTARGTAVAIFASCLFLGQAAGVAAATRIADYAGPTPVFLLAAAILLIVGASFSAVLRQRAHGARTSSTGTLE